MVWSILGWNIHIYHSHLDVHPPITAQKPYWWDWHQDGGRQNREIETDPRPRLSVKLAYWLSDVSETGRGNFTVIPGSHQTNWLPGPPRRDVRGRRPKARSQITVQPRRRGVLRPADLARPVRQPLRRHPQVVFFGYTYRWIAIRDDVADLPSDPGGPGSTRCSSSCSAASAHGGGSGTADGDHHWGHYPQTTPLYEALRDRGLLDPNHPPLIP